MTSGYETIDGHRYWVERDDQGVIVLQLAADVPPVGPVVLTKLEYRALFTLNERIAIDNFAVNPALSDLQKATMTSIRFDFSLADEIALSNSNTIQATELLEQYGLIAPGRAAQILANTPAPA